MLRYSNERHNLGAVTIALGLVIGGGRADGQTLSFHHRFTTSGIYRATAVATDESGIYVAGVRPSARGNRAAVRKYGALGNELWTRDFVTPSYVTAVTADASGVYVGFGEAEQSFLRKFSARGNGVVDPPIGDPPVGWFGCGRDWDLCGRRQLHLRLFRQVQPGRRRVMDEPVR